LGIGPIPNPQSPIPNPQGSIDFKKLHSLIEDLKTIDREVLSNQVEQYSSYASSLIDEKLKNFNERIENRLELNAKKYSKKN
jgi:hypothetical protein